MSSKLSIGEYQWRLESKFLKRTKGKEGPTESLQCATVDVPMVVNGIPVYELQLFAADGKVARFGQGFDVAELEHLSGVINDHIARFQETRR